MKILNESCMFQCMTGNPSILIKRFLQTKLNVRQKSHYQVQF